MPIKIINTFLLLCAIKSTSSVGMGWYLVGLDSGTPTKCESHIHFSASGTLSLFLPEGSISVGSNVLVQAVSPKDAVKAVVQGKITVTDEDGRSYSSTFPESLAFDIGTAADLKAAHSKFNTNNKGILSTDMLIVIEDTYEFADNSWGTDYDYDDFYWKVDVEEVQVTANVEDVSFFAWGGNEVLVEVTPAPAAPYVVLKSGNSDVSTFQNGETEKRLSSPSEEVVLWGGQVLSGSVPFDISSSATLRATISDTSTPITAIGRGSLRKIKEKEGRKTLRKLEDEEEGKPLLSLEAFNIEETFRGIKESVGESILDRSKNEIEKLSKKGAKTITGFLSEKADAQILQTTDPVEKGRLLELKNNLPQLEGNLDNVLDSILLNLGEGIFRADWNAPNFEDAWKNLWHPDNGPADGFGKEAMKPKEEEFEWTFGIDVNTNFLEPVLKGEKKIEDFLDKPGLFIDKVGFKIELGNVFPFPFDDKLIFEPGIVWPDPNRFDKPELDLKVKWQPLRAIPLQRLKGNLNWNVVLSYNQSEGLAGIANLVFEF